MSWRLKAGLLLAIVAVALLIVLKGCNSGASAGGDGVPILRSVADFEQALDRAKALAEGPLRKAQEGEELTEQEREDLAEAYKLERACLEFRPGEYVHALSMAEIAKALGRTEEAIKDYEKALDLIPENPDAQAIVGAVKAHQEVGLIVLAKGEWAHAIEHLKEASDRDPANPFNAAIAGYAMAKNGSLAVAEEYAERALNVLEYQASGNVRLDLAEALHLIGEHELSFDIANDEAEEHPENPDTHYMEAQALVQLGRIEEAKSELQKSLAAEPDHAMARALMALIESDSPSSSPTDEGTPPE